MYVFREGLAIPTRTLLGIVNRAHAVLVLRGREDYFYIHSDFALSTEEEESIMEWGVGRPVYANACLAVGGTLLVAFFEQAWRPALVGTLLVASASYRVQGVLTKVLRVCSDEWKCHGLVPSGIHGTEQVVQIMLGTFVALAELLDDRVLLLTALSFASAYVVIIEAVGQAVTTWGFHRYKSELLAFFRSGILFYLGLVGSILLTYVFASTVFYSVFFCVSVNRGWFFSRKAASWVIALVAVGMMVGVGVIDCKIAVLDGYSEPFYGFRVFGVILGKMYTFALLLVATVRILSYSISVDRMEQRGERTRARQAKDMFSHFHASSIPSRNLLLSSTRDMQHPKGPPLLGYTRCLKD